MPLQEIASKIHFVIKSQMQKVFQQNITRSIFLRLYAKLYKHDYILFLEQYTFLFFRYFEMIYFFKYAK